MTRSRFTAIRLPAGMQPCEPSNGCALPLTCSRYIGTPAKGEEVRDYSTEPGGGGALCEGFAHVRDFIPKPERSWV